MIFKKQEWTDFEVEFLKVNAGVRYWEDATVNGEDDTDGTLIPCRDGDRWQPLIDLDTGTIANWEIGKTAVIHYKICDDGVYQLLDRNKNVIAEKDGHVIDLLCPNGGGDGDYIIFKVDENGKIKNWNCSQDQLEQDFRESNEDE